MMNILYQMCLVPFATVKRFNGYLWIPQGHDWFLSVDDIEEKYNGCYIDAGDDFNSRVDVEITHCRHTTRNGETYIVIGFDTLHLYDEERIAKMYLGDGKAYCEALLHKMLGYAVVAAKGAVSVSKV